MDDQALANLRGYKNKCDICQKDVINIGEALRKCRAAGEPSSNWWADPKIVIGGMAVTLSLGLLVGLAVGK